MEKAKRSLIRVERIDGETAACGLESTDDVNGEWELLAMLGDGLAEWLTANPDKHRAARRFFKRVFKDFCTDWLSYWLDGWQLRLVGCGVIFAAMYAGAAVMKALGA